MPDALFAKPSQVFLGQLFPRGVFLQTVREAGLQLHQAWKLGDQLPRLSALEGRTDRDDQVSERVVARQDLHRRPRAAVRRAQHEQAAARMLHHPRPYLRAHDFHRPGDDPAHRVGEQPHGLIRLLARVEGDRDGFGEAPRFVLDRAPPVEGERDDLVRLRQERGNVVVEKADGSIGLDAVRLAGGVSQRGKAVGDAPAEPDPVALDAKVAAEDAGQDEHRRSIRTRLAGSLHRGARAGCRLARPRQRPDLAEPARLIVGQRRDDGAGRAVVAEVAEVSDLAALVQQVGCALLARRAAVHRARLHDEIVVGPVERIGEQRLQPGRDGVPFDVAGDDAQVAADLDLRLVQPLHERAVGNLRRKAGDHLGIRATAGHLAEQLDELRSDRDPAELQRPLEHGDVRIETLRCQQRPARRAGHTNDARDRDLLFLRLLFENARQRLERSELRPMVLPGERLEGCLGVRVETGEHLRHQPASGMRQQMDVGTRGQGPREGQCVVDGACAKRCVIQPVDG